MIIILVKNFGDLLVSLRANNKLTKKDLAAFIGYTAKQLYRIEKSECIPSLDLIMQLSEFYKINLLKYYDIFIKHNSLDSFIQFSTLINAIENANYSLVEILYGEYEKLSSFSTGENLRLIYYAKAFCCLINKEYNQSLDYCIKGLQYNNAEEFYVNLSSEKIYSNITYNLISCAGSNFYFMEETEKYTTTMLTLYENITKHFFSNKYVEYLNSKFIIRFYSTILNNLSNLNIEKQQYSIALTFIEKAIKYSTETETGFAILDSFYFTKFKCQYYLKQFKDALITLDYCLMLSITFNKKDDFHQYINSLKLSYPNLMESTRLHDILKKYNLYNLSL